jgi:hypothetical protein
VEAPLLRDPLLFLSLALPLSLLCACISYLWFQSTRSRSQDRRQNPGRERLPRVARGSLGQGNGRGRRGTPEWPCELSGSNFWGICSCLQCAGFVVGFNCVSSPRLHQHPSKVECFDIWHRGQHFCAISSANVHGEAQAPLVSPSMCLGVEPSPRDAIVRLKRRFAPEANSKRLW